jgi:hypothetical protein
MPSLPSLRDLEFYPYAFPARSLHCPSALRDLSQMTASHAHSTSSAGMLISFTVACDAGRGRGTLSCMTALRSLHWKNWDFALLRNRSEGAAGRSTRSTTYGTSQPCLPGSSQRECCGSLGTLRRSVPRTGCGAGSWILGGSRRKADTEQAAACGPEHVAASLPGGA